MEKGITGVEDKAGGVFLQRKDPTLHSSYVVETTNKYLYNQTKKPLKNADEKLNAWLGYMDQLYKRSSDDPQALARVKEYYFNKHVTKADEVPEGYYDLQVRIAREQGHGNIKLDANEKQRLADIVIHDQKKSLDEWLDYFISKDSDSYPMWTKYWVFEGLTKLGKLDPELGTFSSRSKGLVAPFPELNREALAMVIDGVVKKANKKSLDEIKDPEFLKLLEGTNFGKLYGHALKQLKKATHDLSVTKGKWVKYNQGSSPDALVESLKGMNTGWCTAGEATARSQLQNGDFYVYYSNNSLNNPMVPRLAIRMDGNSIGEVRGIAKDQNLDPHIAEEKILGEKLKDFGDEGKVYETKTAHMKKLTEIEKKHKSNIELSEEELRFLYELDESIMGFGYQKDPRIDEILKDRVIRKDLAKVLNLKDSEISLTWDEAFLPGIKYHHGNLKLDITSVKGIKLPEIIKGNLSLPLLTSADGLILPKTVGGSLYLSSLKSAEGLILPQSIKRDISLPSLTSAEGLIFPKSHNGDIFLNSLKSAEGLKLPESMTGSLILDSLISAKGLVFPELVKGYISLNSLTSAEGIIFPKEMVGSLHLNSLTTAQGLVLPKTIGGLNLRSLTSAEGLILSHSIKGSIDLNALTSAAGLFFPKTLDGNIYLNSLTTANGLVFPEVLKGFISLKSLTSAEGIIFPRVLDGDLYLNSLKTSQGLVLPNSKRTIYLNGLPSAEGLIIPKIFQGRIVTGEGLR
jgi:hypothetical protein